jgi:N-acetylglucosamine kinase
MKFCAGIDLGGTKIEARLFDQSFNEQNRRRIETPVTSYALLLEGILEQLNWIEKQAPSCPIGLASAGIINPTTRQIFASNLPFDQQHLESDIEQKFGRFVPLLNDSNAFAQSEANFKDTQQFNNIVGLIIGTGVAAGQVFSQEIVIEGANGQWGEIGHIPFPASTAYKYDLPIIDCGCGQPGCFETLLAGPGLVKLVKHKTGTETTTYEIFSDQKYAPLLDIWFEILSDLLAIIAKTNDPEVIVFGGGLGALPIVTEKVGSLLKPKLLPGATVPKLVTAQGGDASGARGAAIYALNRERRNS